MEPPSSDRMFEQPPFLAFSIDRILSPDFGRPKKPQTSGKRSFGFVEDELQLILERLRNVEGQRRSPDSPSSLSPTFTRRFDNPPCLNLPIDGRREVNPRNSFSFEDVDLLERIATPRSLATPSKRLRPLRASLDSQPINYQLKLRSSSTEDETTKDSTTVFDEGRSMSPLEIKPKVIFPPDCHPSNRPKVSSSDIRVIPSQDMKENVQDIKDDIKTHFFTASPREYHQKSSIKNESRWPFGDGTVSSTLPSTWRRSLQDISRPCPKKFRSNSGDDIPDRGSPRHSSFNATSPVSSPVPSYRPISSPGFYSDITSPDSSPEASVHAAINSPSSSPDTVRRSIGSPSSDTFSRTITSPGSDTFPRTISSPSSDTVRRTKSLHTYPRTIDSSSSDTFLISSTKSSDIFPRTITSTSSDTFSRITSPISDTFPRTITSPNSDTFSRTINSPNSDTLTRIIGSSSSDTVLRSISATSSDTFPKTTRSPDTVRRTKSSHTYPRTIIGSSSSDTFPTSSTKSSDTVARTIISDTYPRTIDSSSSDTFPISSTKSSDTVARTIISDTVDEGKKEPGKVSAITTSERRRNSESDAITTSNNSNNNKKEELPSEDAWPVWVYCSRYSARPSSGPRSRRQPKRPSNPSSADEKRSRTAFSPQQLSRLRAEFDESGAYLSEGRRVSLSAQLGLSEAQIKIWFQNRRAKVKRGEKNPLALKLALHGLYNHSTHKTPDTAHSPQ